MSWRQKSFIASKQIFASVTMILLGMLPNNKYKNFSLGYLTYNFLYQPQRNTNFTNRLRNSTGISTIVPHLST